MFSASRWLRLLSLLAVWSLSSHSRAAAELHMKFHTAVAGTNGDYINVILSNEGDANIAYGYVVVTLLDAQCSPLKSLLKDFGNVTPGKLLHFSIPAEVRVRHYRLTTFMGFDGDSLVVPAVDDNASIFKLREPEERALCAQVRFRLVAQPTR